MKNISFFLILLSFIYGDSSFEKVKDENSTTVDNVEVEGLLYIKKVQNELIDNKQILSKYRKLPLEKQKYSLDIILEYSSFIEGEEIELLPIFNKLYKVMPSDNNDSNKIFTDKEGEQKKKLEIYKKTKRNENNSPPCKPMMWTNPNKLYNVIPSDNNDSSQILKDTEEEQKKKLKIYNKIERNPNDPNPTNLSISRQQLK